MIHPASGIYTPQTGWVERIAREEGASVQRDPAEEGARRARQGFDPGKAASISDLANRSVSYQGAIRSLDDISTYLNELI